MYQLKQVFFGQTPFSRTGLILVIIFGIVHPLVFLLFSSSLGNFAAAFSLLPVILTGWYFGWRTAFLASIAATVSNIILLATLTADGDMDEIWLVGGSLLLLVIGIVVGWAGQRIRALQNEIEQRQQAERKAQDMATAAQALREGITAVNSNLPLEAILDQILLQLSQVITYDAANVMMIEGEAGRVFRYRGYSDAASALLQKLRLPLTQAPNLQEMITTRQPIVISHTQNYHGWLPAHSSAWVRSYIGAPIYTHNQVIGFLNVNSATPGFFGQDDAERLQVFADQVAIAIYNAQLLEQTRQQTERLLILLDTARAASATLSLDKVLHLVAEQIVRTLHLSSCNLSRWDHEANTIVPWVEFSQNELKYPEPSNTAYSLGEYPLKRFVLENGETVMIQANDPAADSVEVASMREREIKSLMMLPLATPDRVIGLVELISQDQEREFTLDEMALCQALLDQAAVFIINAGLFEETRRQTHQLSILNELSRQMNMAADVTEICQLVASQLHTLFGFYNVTIFVAEHEAQELTAVATAGAYTHLVPIHQYRQAFSQGLIGQVARTGQPLIANDTHQHPDFFELDGMCIRSEAVLPLITNQKILGILNIDSHQLNAFDEKDASLLTIVASQLATTLEKANLFTEARQRAHQLEALRQASLSVTARLELSRVLQAILGAALGLVEMEGVHIFLYDDEQLRLGAVRWSDGRPDTPFAAPRPNGFTYAVAKQGQLITIPDIRSHSLFKQAPTDWRGSLVGFPLKIGEHVVGVMTVSRAEPGPFANNDLQILQLFADQAAVAIENARLYKRAQEEVAERQRTEITLRQRNVTLELLAELSRTISVPLKTNPILSSVAQLTGKALDFTSVYVCDWDAESGLSTVQAEYVSSEASLLEKLSDLGTVYHLTEDFEDPADWLQNQDQCAITHIDDPDLPMSERAHMEQYGVKSIITVPLWVSDHPIGYLEGWESRYKREFSQDEIERLQAIARQVAMGVHNAMLYESIRQSEKQFRLIFEMAPTGMAIVDLNGRFQQVNQAFCEITGYTAAEMIKATISDLTHPDDLDTTLALDRQLLRGERSYFSIEKRYIHKEGHPIYVILQATLARDHKGAPLHFISQVVDITPRKVVEDQLYHNVFHDTLTNLPNRALFLDHVKRAIGHTERQSLYAFAVLFLDLDRFKVINDSLGHAAGDELLKIMALRLSASVRPGDTVARFGGDEFAVLLDGIQQVSEAQLMAEQIQHSLSMPARIAKHDISLTASIGIALYSSQRQHPEEYVRDADTAMYRAKEQGGNHFVIFDDEMYTSAMERLRLETDLRQAMKEEKLRIFYQPIMHLPDGRITKVECLLRWPHDEQGFISPSQFIPMAEETGLINPIGEWLMRTACKQAKIWHDLGYQIRIAINISVRQFQYQDLPQLIKEILAETNLPATSLELEITESIAMSSFDFSTIPLQKLAAMGVCISVDDFGTGYSSLSRLKTLPISNLKIDRSFIIDLVHNESDRAMVQAIIAMAHSLNLEVVAEGVETLEQLAYLWQQQCDQVQGYLISRPLSSSDLLTFVRENVSASNSANSTAQVIARAKEMLGEH